MVSIEFSTTYTISAYRRLSFYVQFLDLEMPRDTGSLVQLLKIKSVNELEQVANSLISLSLSTPNN